MTSTDTERYRWLARKSAATRRPRHVFVGDHAVSLCTCAVRTTEWDAWQPDAEREDCRVCLGKLARAHENGHRLTEVTW